jgi:hypothetical protein
VNPPLMRNFNQVLAIALLAAGALLNWLCFADLAAGDPASPLAMLPELADEDFAPRLGTYHYRFKWILRIGADADVSVLREGDEYVVATRVETGWFIDRIYRLRFYGSARLRAADFAPIRVDIKEEVRSTRKQVRMLYQDGEIVSERVKKKPGRDLLHQSYQQDARDGRVMDPFSATLVARSMPWALGDLRTIDVFDGRRMNQVTMECVGREEVETLGERRSAWVVKLKIVQGDPENIDEDDELITDQVTVYLSADASREVLRIEADTKFGDIEVLLEEFRSVS